MPYSSACYDYSRTSLQLFRTNSLLLQHLAGLGVALHFDGGRLPLEMQRARSHCAWQALPLHRQRAPGTTACLVHATNVEKQLGYRLSAHHSVPGLRDKVHSRAVLRSSSAMLASSCQHSCFQRASERLSGVMSMKARVWTSQGPCLPEVSAHVSGTHFNLQTNTPLPQPALNRKRDSHLAAPVTASPLLNGFGSDLTR